MLENIESIKSKFARGGYNSVLIVTPLILEARAVLPHLENIKKYAGRSNTTYRTGLVQAHPHTWWAAVIQPGDTNEVTTRAITQALNDLEEIDLVLLVGIAGTLKNLPIGSVIAASKVYNAYAEKFGETTTQRPALYPTSSVMQNVARDVALDAKWHTNCRSPENCSPALISPIECPDCEVAPIVSVDGVIANADSRLYREISAKFSDASAIEMEGFGAMTAMHAQENTPCLVIRGVSDDANAKTPDGDKKNQPLAAMHAAAFAIEVLRNFADLRKINKPPIVPGRPINRSNDEASFLPTHQQAPEKFVVVLDLNATPSSPELVSLLDAIRTFYQNKDIALDDVTEGSVILHLSVDSSVAALLRRSESASRLSTAIGVRIISIMETSQYQEVQRHRGKIEQATPDLRRWPQTLGNGTWIARPEIDKITDLINRFVAAALTQSDAEKPSRVLALTGPPGAGKSALLARLSDQLSVRSAVNVISLKADAIPSHISTDRELGAHLNLDTTFVDAVNKLAAFKPVILLIDQLDALAGYIDLKTARLNVLLNAVHMLSQNPRILTIISSRTFEYDHDVRLSVSNAERIELSLPDWSAIHRVLESHGLGSFEWSQSAIQQLRSPHILRLYLDLVQNAPQGEKLGAVAEFTYQSLLDRLWDTRILNDPSGERLRIVNQLAHDISEYDTLWIPRAKYEEAELTLRHLVSDNILAQSDNPADPRSRSIGFKHQTYYEHALARACTKRQFELADYVDARKASLFVRPRIWACINYLRGSAVDAANVYRTELEELWRRTSDQPHIRRLLLEFFCTRNDPLPFEVQLVKQYAAGAPVNARLIASLTAQNPVWFPVLKTEVITDVMTGSTEEATAAIELLSHATSDFPSDVAELLRTYWTPDSTKHRLVWFVLANAHGWSESLTSVAVDLAQRPSADRHFLDATTIRIAEEQPTAALQIIKAYISTVAARIKKLLAESAYSPGDRVGFNLQQSIRKEFEILDNLAAITELAAQHGKDFIALLWPSFEVLFETIEVEGDFADRGFRSYGHDSIAFSQQETDEDDDGDDYRPSGASTALDGLVTAAVAFWQVEPAGFADWLGKVQKTNSLFTQRMIALTLAAIGAPIAAYTVKFLCSDPRRLLLGTDAFSNRTGTTALLIKTISPHLGKDEILLLEGAVVSAFPPPSADEPATSRKGSPEAYDRLSLLRAIGKNVLSPEAADILAADEDAIGNIQPVRGRSGWVGSPMTSSDMGSSSDTEIVGLFKTLVDATDWNNPDFEMRLNLKGGSIQASREFAAFARSNPDRAASIIDKFEKGGQERPAGYAIAAMAGQPQDGPRDQHTPADPAQVMALIRKCVDKGFYHPEFRGSVASAIDHLSRREAHIPEDMITLLENWLSTPSSEPDEDDDLEDLGDVNQLAAEEDSREKERELKNGIIWNSHRFERLPGGNFQFLDALSNILLSKPQRNSGRWLDILEQYLVSQDDESVWSSLLRFFEYVEEEDRPRASEFIATLCDKYPALALRASTVRLLARIHWWLNPDLLRRLTENFGNSDSKLAKQAYGELIGLLAIVKWDSNFWSVAQLNELLGASVQSQKPAWLGFALSAANLIGHQEFSEQACRVLIKAIETHDKEVLDAAFEVFRVTDKLPTGDQTKALFGAVNRAIEETIPPDPTFLVEHLERLLPQDPDLVANLCSTLVKRAGSDLGNFSTSLASIAPNLVNIALTLHRAEGEIGQKGLHLFEALLEVDAYGAKAALTEIDDRPVRVQSRPVRTRKFSRPRRRGRRPA